MTGHRRLALAGIAGPAALVADWAILGVVARHYHPVRDTVSRLAETGVPTQPAMTVGFCLYGAALPAFALSDDQQLPRLCRALIAATGVSTLVVAAFPVSAARTGAVHAAAAGIGYVTLAAAPLCQAQALAAAGKRGPALGSAVIGLTCGALLAASVALPVTGVLQRAGLTVGDAWIVAQAVAALRRSAR